MCGEKRKKGAVPAPSPGSPPRMRGKGPQHLPPALQNGITPAYAGKSFGSFCFLSFRQDHPRVCGEKQAAVALPQPVLGSPPRMRGKVVLSSENPLCRGITPAYAGKSRSSARPHHSHRDHPRACGEKTEYRALVTAHQGSPPRMRGKVFIGQVCIAPKGITPACAGKSLRPDNNPSTSWDHPRVCGEKTKKIP